MKNEEKRLAAIAAFTRKGMMGKSYHKLVSSEVDLVLEWAVLTSYRKPASANGSRARYFWESLERLRGKYSRFE